MPKKGHTEEQIITALKQYESDKVADICRDCQPFGEFDEHPALNAAYSQRLHRDLTYQRG
jgi:hypothetical protein